VQPFASSQLNGVPETQFPSMQRSIPVQRLLSVQSSSPSHQHPGVTVCTHPVCGLQLSPVQPSPSSQLRGSLPRHVPFTQELAVVQTSLSSQEAVLSAWTQPDAGSQLSVVQTLPSSQFGAESPTQAPPEQVSAVVQTLPSLQETVLLA
jgi:hypothetical protein